MIVMLCNRCNSEIENEWRFCAYCGANINENAEKLTELALSIISSLQGARENSATMKIASGNSRKALLHNERKIYAKREKQNNFLNTPNKPIEVVEPKTEITRLPGRIMLETEIPGVESGSDIKIMLLGESIEIRAAAPEKMYMKILRIPRNMQLAGSSFADGRLKIALGEGMRR